MFSFYLYPPPNHNRFTFSGTTRVSQRQKRTSGLHGARARLTEADTPTIRLGATPSGLTSAHLHHPRIYLYHMTIYLQDVVNCIKHDGDDFGVLDGQHITQWLHSLTMYTVRDLLHGAAWSQVGNHPNSLLLALEVTLFYQHTSISVTWNKQSYNTSIQTAMWIIYHRLEQLSPFHLTQDNPCTMILWRTNLRHN